MRIDATIKRLAAEYGEKDISKEKVASVRKRLETAYLNSVLDGTQPFCTHEGEDNVNGKT